MSETSTQALMNFRKLWAGQGISQFGSQVSILAIPTLAILVYDATPFQASLLGAIQIAPFAFFALPAGPLIDRLPRGPVAVVCDIGRAAAIGGLAATYLSGFRHLWVVYVVAALVGTFTVFFEIAYLSFIPVVVPEDSLLSANSRISATDSAASTLGPGIGGLLISWLGPAKALILDSVSYVVSAVSLALIRVEEPRRDKPKLNLRSLATEIQEGLVYIARSPILSRIAITNAVFDFGAAIIEAVYFVFLYRSLQLEPNQVGVLMGVTGASFLVGAVLLPRVTKRFGVGPTLFYSILAGGVVEAFTPLALVGLAIPILVGISIVGGSTNALYDINQRTLRQYVTPDELQGRVHATIRMTFETPRPFGYVLGGALATFTGTAPTIFVGAVISTIGASILATGPVRQLRTFEEIGVDREDGAAVLLEEHP